MRVISAAGPLACPVAGSIVAWTGLRPIKVARSVPVGASSLASSACAGIAAKRMSRASIRVIGRLRGKGSSLASAKGLKWNFPVPSGLPSARVDPLAVKAARAHMSVLISILITFLVVILILYLINMLPIAGRAKQIAQIIVIVIGILSLLKYINVF
jgi:hypothetical protein